MWCANQFKLPLLSQPAGRAGPHPVALLDGLPSVNLEPEDLRVGRTVIPTLAVGGWESRAAFRSAREDMFAAGLYPGVDYIIEQRAGDMVTLRPEYPLVKKLEREWPVSVPVSLAPRWTTPAVYNAFTAAFAVGLFSAIVAGGVALSTVLTLSKIPSASMYPAIQPNDVLLVEKISPKLGLLPKRGDIVLFEPPPALRAIVTEREGQAAAAAKREVGRLAAAQQTQLESQQAGASPSPPPARVSPFLGGGNRGGVAGPQLKRLFVKRIAAVPGDEVRVYSSGNTYVNKVGTEGRGASVAALERAASEQADGGGGVVVGGGGGSGGPPPLLRSLLKPGELRVRADEFFVLGDNSDVSIDSRVWGTLPKENLAGRPLLRVLPFSRFGMIEHESE